MEIHCKYDALVPLEELIPNPLNANDHSDEQIERLCLLFDTYGIRHPIICDLETRVMAVGHGRLLAAKKKKMDAYPVVYQKFKSKDEFDQFAIADNAIALWAELNLKLINERLPAWGPELNIKALAIKDFVLEPADKYTDAVPNPTLADRFLIVPFSVLDARQGYWQDRKRQWIALGIKSEIGRGGATVAHQTQDKLWELSRQTKKQS